MLILTIRTDNPEAEIGLYDASGKLGYKKWQAHHELGKTIHITIEEILIQQKFNWQDISGIVFYKGPGSFTGLRIGASVANAIAYANNIPVSNQNGNNWVEKGLVAFKSEVTGIAVPEYGSDPHITAPKK